MSSNVAKIAVSLPKDTAKKLDEFSHRLGKGRSALMLEALKMWFGRNEEAALESRYTNSYRRNPEKPAEINPLYQAGLASFSQENW